MCRHAIYFGIGQEININVLLYQPMAMFASHKQICSINRIHITKQTQTKQTEPNRTETMELYTFSIYDCFCHLLSYFAFGFFSALHLFAFVSSWHFIFSIRFARRELYHIVVEWSLFTPSNTFISNNEKYFTCHSYLWQTFLIHRILFDGTKFYAKNAIW